ncbi:MAG: helix-turn-helix domain-containing protein [Pyrinomonadaceae bacterium MAG19_C2-C3]|nr:helix-turn-helix domain-containing protein [Pyrinomonadaceae bacterium MAG19_C2-C3]
MAEQDLTTTQVAERLKVANVTVRLWCRQGRFPNAHAVDTPRGSLWYIPERDINNFTQPLPGRPPQAKPEAPSTTNGKPKITTKQTAKKGSRK